MNLTPANPDDQILGLPIDNASPQQSFPLSVKKMRPPHRVAHPPCSCICPNQAIEGLFGTLGFGKAYALGSSGRTGSLVLFCNNNINIEILGYSEYDIDAKVSTAGEDDWRLTSMERHRPMQGTRPRI